MPQSFCIHFRNEISQHHLLHNSKSLSLTKIAKRSISCNGRDPNLDKPRLFRVTKEKLKELACDHSDRILVVSLICFSLFATLFLGYITGAIKINSVKNEKNESIPEATDQNDLQKKKKGNSKLALAIILYAVFGGGK